MPIPRPVLTKLAETGTEDGTSQQATLALGEVSLVRKLSCFYAETGAVALHFLGTSRLAGGRLERLLPAAHPSDPTLAASRVSILRQHKFTGPRGADPLRPGGRSPADGGPPNLMPDQSVAATYYKAEIQVEYQRITYALKTDAEVPADQEYLRYLDVGELKPSEDVYTLPGHALSFLRASGSTPPHTYPLGFNVPRVNAVFDVELTWRRLPTDLIDIWNPGPWLLRLYGDPHASSPVKPYIGAINKSTFAGFPPGTLLFKSWRPVRRPAPFLIYVPVAPGATDMTYLTPAVEWDVVFDMRYDPQGHNYKFYNDPPPPDATRAGKGNSGVYFVGRGNVHYPPGNVPDDYSLFNERELKDLFKVTG